MTRGRIDFGAVGQPPHIRLIDDVDFAAVGLTTDDAIRSNIDATQPVIVDLRDCTFLDSTGIGFLIGVQRIAPSVVLRDARPMILRMFEITGTMRLFRFETTPCALTDDTTLQGRWERSRDKGESQSPARRCASS